jgi:hypothetical protein
MSETLDTQPREPGCLCQWEPGDSYCRVHGPEICGCDEALALRAELDDARRRIANQAESLKVPRVEDVVCIHGLERELARTRFVSVLRGKCADGWSAMLEKTEAELGRVCAELAEANRRLREDKHADNTLEWRHMVDALRTELAEANNRWHSACDVGRRLEVRNAQLLNELEGAHTLRPLQICTPAERKVLDAVACLSADHLRGILKDTTQEELAYPEVVAGVAFCKAVLALLEGK